MLLHSPGRNKERRLVNVSESVKEFGKENRSAQCVVTND